TWPPVARFSLPLGLAKLVVFVRLNTWARNSKLLDSVTLKDLISDMSNCTSRSPRSVLRPRLPYVNCAGSAKVSTWAGSNARQAGFAEVKYQQFRSLGWTAG